MGSIDRNPARVTGWQREYQRAEGELDDPRSLRWQIGRRWSAWPPRSWPARTGTTKAGAMPWKLLRAPRRVSGRSPVSGRKTLTGRDGSGLCVGRPPRALVASSTKAPKEAGPHGSADYGDPAAICRTAR